MVDEGDEAAAAPPSGPIDPQHPVLEMSPAELRVDCQLNTELSFTFSLKSVCAGLVAFKVKTTAPKRYMVRPAQGTISEGETATITIVLVKLTQYPDPSNPRNLRDKFLVQSVPIAQEMSAEDLNAFWLAKEKQHNPQKAHAYCEHRLKCRLVVPTSEPDRKKPAMADAKPGSDLTDTHPSKLDIVISAPPDSTSTLPVPPALPAPAESESIADEQEDRARSDQAGESSPERQPDAASTAAAVSEDTLPSSAAEEAEAETRHHHRSTSSIASSRFFAEIDKNPNHDKVLAFCLKLTIEREALETQAAKLTQQNAAFIEEIEQLRKALATARGQPSIAPSTSGPQRSVLEALQTSGVKYRSIADADTDFSEHISSLASSQLVGSTGIQLWQVVLVASLSFLMGRLL